MVTYETLVNQAKQRGMPGNKTRGILREYLQVLILKELYRVQTVENFFFTGGTYLRLVHRTKRFSEDLDFNTSRLTKAGFEGTLKKIISALKNEGMESRLEFDHWQNLWVARIVFPDIENFYWKPFLSVCKVLPKQSLNIRQKRFSRFFLMKMKLNYLLAPKPLSLN